MHKSDEQGCLCAAALNFIGNSSLTTAVTLHITQKQLQPKAAVPPHTARYTAADLYKLRTSQEQDNIERTLASGRRPAPTPLRRPWRSWAPPIFGNVFCPEDLEDHYHHQYYPQGLTRAQAQQQLQLQHQQQQEEADHLSAEALVPANSLFCGQPSLVLSPDGCEIAVARRLKQTSYSTEISTQNSSYQPKGPNESTTVVQTSSNAGSQAPVGPCTEMDYRPSVVLYVGHVHIVGKHKTSPPHTYA